MSTPGEKKLRVVQRRIAAGNATSADKKWYESVFKKNAARETVETSQATIEKLKYEATLPSQTFSTSTGGRTQKYYYNPITKSYSTQRIPGQQAVSLETAKSSMVQRTAQQTTAEGRPTIAAFKAQGGKLPGEEGFQAQVQTPKTEAVVRVSNTPAVPNKPKYPQETTSEKSKFWNTALFSGFGQAGKAAKEAAANLIRLEKQGVDTGARGEAIIAAGLAAGQVEKTAAKPGIAQATLYQTPKSLGISAAMVGGSYLLLEGISGVGAARAAATKATQQTAKTAATKAAQQTAKKALQEAAKATPSTAKKVADYTKYIAQQTGRAYIYPKAFEAAGSLTASKEQKEIMRSREFKEAFGIASRKQEQAGETWYKNVALNLPIVPLLYKKETFKESLKQQGQSLGYTGKELDNFVEAGIRRQKFGQFGELITQLDIGRASESYGRKAFEVAKSEAAKKGAKFTEKQAFSKLFGLSFGPIARAGTGEGLGFVLAQQESRGDTRGLLEATPKQLLGYQYNSNRLMELVGGYTLGGLSAGVIGGTIAGTRLRRPGVSKALELGAYVTDPLEKPSDILQDITEFGIRKATGKTPSVTAIVPTSQKADYQIGGTTTKRGKAKVKSRSTVQSFGFVSTPVENFVNTQTPVKTNTNVLVNVPTSPTNIPTLPSSVQTKTNIFTDIINSPVDVPTDIPADVPVNVPTDIMTNIFAPVNIPTVTPMLRVPPPLPFALPFDLGGAGTRKGKGLKYLNELQYSRDLLYSFTVGSSKPMSKKNPFGNLGNFEDLIFGKRSIKKTKR